MKRFECSRCGHLVFFENVVCERCGASLGYLPDRQMMTAFHAVSADQWQLVNVDFNQSYRPCQNYTARNVCNWMVIASDQNRFCLSCRFTAMIPDISVPANLGYWYLLEAAKRRLFYTLLQIGLPIPDRQADPAYGLVFIFLADSPNQKVLTGHENGQITVNIEEADDAVRELKRKQMHEPYRTLLGHFRHEIGHFYWLHLVSGAHWFQRFRTLFGDERQDYAQAMDRYYANGAQPDWSKSFISEYATMHPWEDWAETWAHYLHIVDALDTAANWPASIAGRQPRSPFGSSGQPLSIAEFEQALLNDWLPLGQFLNSMNRSLGQKDAYPFVIAPAVVRKLCFIHELVLASRIPSEPVAS